MASDEGSCKHLADQAAVTTLAELVAGFEET